MPAGFPPTGHGRANRQAAAGAPGGEARRWLGLALAASAAGAAVSAYLAGAAGGLGAAGSAAGGGVAEGAAVPFCGPGSSCAQVWSSPFGRLAGLPLPVWGLGMFLLLVAGGVAWWRAATRPRPSPRAAR